MIYPETMHAFHREGSNYHAEAAKDSWSSDHRWLATYPKLPVSKG